MYYVYMLTNKWRNVLNVGTTDELKSRLRQHKDGVFDGFTKRNNCDHLLYFGKLDSAAAASKRERQLKGWTRARKNALVESVNPDWNDLSPEILRS